MAYLVEVEAAKTYATHENCVKAVQKVYGEVNELRYMVCKNEAGRYFPVFIGETALRYMVHFKGWCVVG